ncbi:MAG: hypothetical protein QXR60_00855 [Candidatus Nanoarchaeia archaeon]
MVSFTKREVWYLIFATLALGFVFGFDDGRPEFVLSYWLLNFFRVCLACFAVLLAYALAQKLVANHYGCSAEFSLWTVQRYGFRPYAKFKRPFPIGVLIGFIVAVLSQGKFFFADMASVNFMEQRQRRIGRKYLNVTASEIAKIALAGVFAALLIALLASILNLGKELVLVASLFAVYQMLPLPNLDGIKIFFGSLPMFAFSAAFVLLCAILLNFISGFSAVFYAFIAASIFFILFFYYRVYSS